MLQSRQKSLVDPRQVEAGSATIRKVPLEAAPLFIGVGEFVKSIGQLETLDKDFDAFGERRVVVTNPGEGRLADRKIVDE